MYKNTIHNLNNLVFKNSTQNAMSFDEVFENMLAFIRRDPASSYKLAIGTDSHVKNITRFVTAIHLHRIGTDGVGKGAWGCVKEHIVHRKITSLREKISIETSLTQNLLYLIDYNRMSQMLDILIPYADKGADLSIEAHIDIGTKGATRDLIQEMVGRFMGMGIDAKIKPDSYAASSYADRYTKC